MTLGAGIAVAAIWICATVIVLHRSISGQGAMVALSAAVAATAIAAAGLR